ncbi:Panacea domain-containing protein [Putridiphycobacter roseus]|uniref:Panacea domain-containing protein n=1 Tax=Putridiphycobacter roseus TaxID=2219161 RepID=UPI001F3067F9|nr:Panacea domain-containing protein [Putridiphycobacter roseus]
MTHSDDEISKIGNTIVFLINEYKDISKTKLLKLLYILDEMSIKKSGIPFLNLNYKVWKFGPVAVDIFAELSSSPSILKPFITKLDCENGNDFKVIVDFSDDEFSINDLELLNKVSSEFGVKSASELIKYTHRETSLWYKIALENGVLEDLEKERISTTELTIDLSELIKYDERKASIYEEYLEMH